MDNVRNGIGVVRSMHRAGLLGPVPPSRLARMILAARGEGVAMTSGFAIAAQRCPRRPGLIDELGLLTWDEIDRNANSLATAMQLSGDDRRPIVAIMARNHRGFVHALIAANRIGADVLLLNTSFAGPALTDVVARETAGRSLIAIYDEEFTDHIDQVLSNNVPELRLLPWTDTTRGDRPAADALIERFAGSRPRRTAHAAKIILLTSGTTSAPKGAKHSGGGPRNLKAVLDGTPWRAEETTVIVAPMFHAWDSCSW